MTEFKITDEKTKAALIGYVALLVKNQSLVISEQMAEVNTALEAGDLDKAYNATRVALVAMSGIVHQVSNAQELTSKHEALGIAMKYAAGEPYPLKTAKQF